jgi:hypothetical protein
VVSHPVSGHAACPWRLYYIRYYARVAVNMSQTERPVRDPGVRVVSMRNGTAERLPARAALSGGVPYVNIVLANSGVADHISHDPVMISISRNDNFSVLFLRSRTGMTGNARCPHSLRG